MRADAGGALAVATAKLSTQSAVHRIGIEATVPAKTRSRTQSTISTTILLSGVNA